MRSTPRSTSIRCSAAAWSTGSWRRRGSPAWTHSSSTAPSTADAFDGVEVAVQVEPLGTGDAVRSARSLLEGRVENLLVLSGDTPLLRPALLRELVEAHRRAAAHATVLSFEPDDPRRYGRILRAGNGGWRDRRGRRRDARAARDPGGQLVDLSLSRGAVVAGPRPLCPHNVQRELYLTDSVALLVADGGRVAVHKGGDPWRRRASIRGWSLRRPLWSCATGSTKATCSPA